MDAQSTPQFIPWSPTRAHNCVSLTDVVVADCSRSDSVYRVRHHLHRAVPFAASGLRCDLNRQAADPRPELRGGTMVVIASQTKSGGDPVLASRPDRAPVRRRRT